MLTSNGYVLAETSRRLGRLEPVPASERGARESLLRRLDADGYLFLTGQIDAQIVEGFRRYYFEALAETGVEGPTGQVDQARLRHLLFREIVPGAAYAALCSTP